MQGIVVRYRYSGDEADWKAAMRDFIDAIGADEAVSGRFRYVATVAADGVARLHMGRWDSEETLKTVQSRDYFQRFTAAVQRFAGDTLESVRIEVGPATD